MEITLIGIVKKDNETVQVTDTFSKKQIVITIDADTEHPQDIPVEFVNNNIAKLDSMVIGDRVEVRANLRGSEYQDKNYLNLTGWFYKKL